MIFQNKSKVLKLIIVILLFLVVCIGLKLYVYLQNPHNIKYKYLIFNINNYDLNKLIQGDSMYFEIDYDLGKKCTYTQPASPDGLRYLCTEPYTLFTHKPDMNTCEAFTDAMCNKNGVLMLLTSKFYSSSLTDNQRNKIQQLIRNKKIKQVQIKVAMRKFTDADWIRIIQIADPKFPIKPGYRLPANQYVLPKVVGLVINQEYYPQVDLQKTNQ